MGSSYITSGHEKKLNEKNKNSLYDSSHQHFKSSTGLKWLDLIRKSGVGCFVIFTFITNSPPNKQKTTPIQKDTPLVIFKNGHIVKEKFVSFFLFSG